jgi:hypothetical protein
MKVCRFAAKVVNFWFNAVAVNPLTYGTVPPEVAVAPVV